MKSFRHQDWWTRVPKIGGPRGECRLGGPNGYTVHDNAFAGVVFVPLKPTRIPDAGVAMPR